MLQNIYKKWGKNYFLNYTLFALLLFVLSSLYNYINGGSVKYVKNIFVFLSIYAYIYILLCIISDYAILKILKVKVAIRVVHKDFAWVNMLKFTMGFLCILFFHNKFVIVLFNSIIKIILFVYQVYIIKNVYDASVPKCIGYVAFAICGEFLLGILNDNL